MPHGRPPAHGGALPTGARRRCDRRPPRRQLEDPLRPVADLRLTAEVDLDGDGSDERVGEFQLARGARPVERGPQVRPQLAEPGNALDLVGARERGADLRDLVFAPVRVSLGDRVHGIARRELLRPRRRVARGLVGVVYPPVSTSRSAVQGHSAAFGSSGAVLQKQESCWLYHAT